MTYSSKARQAGAIPWWLIFTVAVAVAAYLGWQRFNTVQRLAPSVPALVSPESGHMRDPDVALNQLVWRHTEPDAGYRNNMQFGICILKPGENCAGTSPVLRRWNVNVPDPRLAVSSVPSHSLAREYVFNIPDPDELDFEPDGQALNWTVIACWPGAAGRCAEAPVSPFVIAGPNLAAETPSALGPPGSGVRTGAFTFSVRAHNTSQRDSGTFTYDYWYAQVVVDQFGQPVLSVDSPAVQPNPRIVTRDGKVLVTTVDVDPAAGFGFLVPGTSRSQVVRKTASIASTVGGNPQPLDSMSPTVTTPVGLAIFLQLDPDNNRIELDENDNFKAQLETAL